MPPHRDPEARRKANREAQARWRARQRAAKAAARAVAPAPATDDPVGAIERWARETLRVPTGHPRAGEPMALPGFAADFLRGGWEARESALCVARKNGKTAICAILTLAHLCGIVGSPGVSIAVVSLDREKANVLRGMVESIAVASGLADRLTFRRSPYPGSIESSFGRLSILSADKGAGHAFGFDVVIVDETGLFEERDRELIAGCRSSVSARNGRVIHISIRGSGPLMREMLESEHVYSVEHAAPRGARLDDEAAWRASNPGLGSIKSVEYMRDAAAHAAAVPSDEALFRAFDMNEALDPVQELVCSPDDLAACWREPRPERSGPVVLGFDFGEAVSATCAAAIWPEVMRCELWMAFGDRPNLVARGRFNDAPYALMAKRGELRTYPGRVVPIGEFLADVAADLEGEEVIAAASDSYKDNEARNWLEQGGVGWPLEVRRKGAGKSGGRDVREFQRAVIGEPADRLRLPESLALADAIRKSVIHRDPNGNPGIRRAKHRAGGSIDILTALVLATGLATEYRAAMRRPPGEIRVLGTYGEFG